jgi:hypothetical protein
VKLPAAQRVPALDAFLGGDDEATIRAALARLYSGTAMGATEERLKWLGNDRAAFEASTDPLLKLVVALLPTYLQLEDAQRTRSGEYARYRPTYLQAVIDYRRSQGGAVYPDANGSLRITFGNVMGYVPRDGVAYTAFTTLEGLAAKATGEEPFDAPANQLEAIRAQRYGQRAEPALGSVPVNFLSDLDITGGNSGSPVMGADGRLVGLAFDGNWESVSSNWIYEGEINRMIAVETRYMLWVMEHAYPAPELLQELQAAQAR